MQTLKPRPGGRRVPGLKSKVKAGGGRPWGQPSLTLLWSCCFSGEIYLPQPCLAPERACISGTDQWKLPGPLLCCVALPDE